MENTVNLMTSGQSILSSLLGIYEVIKIVKLLMPKVKYFSCSSEYGHQLPCFV